MSSSSDPILVHSESNSHSLAMMRIMNNSDGKANGDIAYNQPPMSIYGQVYSSASKEQPPPGDHDDDCEID